MATKRTATKSLKPVETVEQAAADEALATIEAAIQQVVDTFGVSVQRARLKGIRALAYQALLESIEAGDLEALTQRAIANAGSLPNGWTVTPPKRAPKPERKPRASKGSTVATEEGVVIAEQRHVDASVPVVHDADPNKANGCTCGQSYGSKAALSRHLNVAAKA
ncbi:hypothetical protein Q9S36_03150 [Microbacterium sp. ARD31]|uniref:hypothetical protein n=1 Tax=Microbacterium sp. ARD31 TaxID=2962576 RepID=UPI002882C3F2|nr:hypothetical protein [Microbacterium sp. ARD31]MDT0179205.1 hypothetical protein [Microbacterium sp. ARD31]